MPHTSCVIDLWIRQPYTFLTEALQEGFRGFTWHIGMAMAKKLDPIARIRIGALGYSQDVRLMLIDHAGAPEFGLFSTYDKPLAVYPTWACDEDWSILEGLVKKNVADDEALCSNTDIRPEHRPVFGQKHRVVIHRLPPAHNHADLMLRIMSLQEKYPDCELFVSGLASFDFMFSWGLKAGDMRPSCMTGNQIFPKVVLPSGKKLGEHQENEVYDPRYADWFDLLGITQDDLLGSYVTDRKLFPRFTLRSAQWARRNYSLVSPFVLDRTRNKKRFRALEPGLVEASNATFVLPAARRRVMRNIGMDIGELDKFACDTCILQNACTLYREGAVCSLKGSEGVALADAFGTRSASRIIDGLSELLKKQAERLEDSMAAEDPADPNPDITRQLNAVFGNGVKLAKLIDPSLAGGPSVQVNVGVGAGGNASIVAQQDPRQLTASIVRELESQGIPRDKITGEMIAGVFKSMGMDATKKQAITAAKVSSEEPVKSLPEDMDPEETLVDKSILTGEIV